MPRYSKPRYKRPGYKACGKMVASDASKALTMARHLKTMMNVEYKHLNHLITPVAITDAGLIVNDISFLIEGNTSQTRDGGQVKFTSFRFAYNATIHASASRSLLRVMIVHDKQTNQATFTLADLLFDGTVVDAIHSPYNINNASRFNILYDKVHVLSTADETSIYRTIIRKLALKVRYDANAGTIADLSQDSLSLVFIGDQATNDPSVAFNWRSRFIDN